MKPDLQVVPVEDCEDEGRARLARFDGQPRCEHDVPVGLHAAPGRPGHDCAYANARTSLIPAACTVVKAAQPLLEEGTARWCEVFGRTMDRMVRERLTR